MMSKFTSRTLHGMLALVMAISLLPTMVFAENLESTANAEAVWGESADNITGSGTFEKAFEEAVKRGTSVRYIKLIDEVNVENSFTIPNSNVADTINFTLDFNGHKIKSENGNALFTLTSKCNLTFTDTSNNKDGGFEGYSLAALTGSAKLKVEAGVYSATHESDQALFTLGNQNVAELTISGGTFNYKMNAIEAKTGGSNKNKIMIKGGTFNYAGDQQIGQNGAAAIKIHTNVAVDLTERANPSNLSIYFYSTTDYEWKYSETIKLPYGYKMVDLNGDNTSEMIRTGTFKIQEQTEEEKSDIQAYWYSGNTKYQGTLEEAFTWAKNNSNVQKIELAKSLKFNSSQNTPVISGGTFTLDLKGHEISSTDRYALEVSGNANVTLTDTSEEETGKLSAQSATIWLSDNASLTIEKGTLDSAVNDAIYIKESEASLIIRGGVFNGDKACVSMYGKLLKITGGTFNSNEPTIYYVNGTVDLSEWNNPAGITMNGDNETSIDGKVLLPQNYYVFNKNDIRVTEIDFDGVYTIKYHLHNWSYSLNDAKNSIQVICENSTDNLTCLMDGGSVSIQAPTDLAYTGNKIEAKVTNSLVTDDTVNVVYSGNITEGYPVNAGSYTASITLGNKTIQTTYTIEKVSLENAEVLLDWVSTTYDGDEKKPNVSVKLGSETLTEDKDYTLSYQNNINAGTATAKVTGIGNYKGVKTKDFDIENADFDEYEVTLKEELVYTGSPLTPVVEEIAVTKGNQTASFTYSLSENGVYGAMPTFTYAGNYELYYKVSAENHNDSGGYLTIEVKPQLVSVPTIQPKEYNGSLQTADIEDTELYTVKQNNGGTLKGSYDVILSLKDNKNYQWATSEEQEITLAFEICSLINEWTDEPTAQEWVYGNYNNEIHVGKAKYGEVTVTYTGVCNDGTSYSGTQMPTKAGNYSVIFTVEETDNYSGLNKTIDFAIERADYDMSKVRWNYQNAFDYDGMEHSVTIDETTLPSGVIVKSYSGDNATEVGDYYANVIFEYDENNYNEPMIASLEWNIVNTWTPIEYTSTTLNQYGYTKGDFTIRANEDYLISLGNGANSEWKNELTYTDEIASDTVEFYLKNTKNGTISLAQTITYGIDKTAPSGMIENQDYTWDSFVTDLKVGYYNEKLTMVISGDDTISEVAKIEVIISQTALTQAQLQSSTNWNVYNGSFDIDAVNDMQYICYARISDKAGNVTYLSTDLMKFDLIAPTISGVDEENIYYTTQKVIISDANLQKIELNEAEKTETELTLAGNRSENYYIRVTDKAGNISTVTVTMMPISELSERIESLDTNNVTNDSEETIVNLLNVISAIDITNAEENEKSLLNAIVNQCDQLKTVIDNLKAELSNIQTEMDKYDNDTVTSANKAAIESLNKKFKAVLSEKVNNCTEEEKNTLQSYVQQTAEWLEIVENAADALNTEKINNVKNVQANNVTFAYRADLEEAREDFEEALDIYGSNYTNVEKEQIQADLYRIQAALKVLERVEAVEDKIVQIPEDITKEDEKVIQAAAQAYHDLTEYEKSLLNEELRYWLNNAQTELEKLNKKPNNQGGNGESNNNPTTGDTNNSFLWIMILLVSGLFAVYFDSKRKAKKC